jgi:hypothetical protein
MNGLRKLIPALLIRTSTPPTKASISSNARSTASASDTSAWSVPSSAGSSILILSKASAFLSRTTTFAPSSKNLLAVAAPMPLAPPVIKTRFFANPCIDLLL